MGFADEIKAARSQPSESTPAPEAKDPVEEFNTGLPSGSDPLDASNTDGEVAPKPESKAQPKIKIGTQEFDSMDDAIAYAQTVEQARAQDQAYIEGLKDAQPKVTKEEVKQKELEEEVEELFFENPKEALKKFKEGITKQIFDSYEKAIAQQEQAKVQQQTVSAIWDNFYKANSDLSESKDIVEFLRVKHWNEIKDIPEDKALKILADNARKQLKITRDANLPSKELPDGPARVAGASGEATSTNAAATPEKELDFVAQLAKLRKKAAQV